MPENSSRDHADRRPMSRLLAARSDPPLDAQPTRSLAPVDRLERPACLSGLALPRQFAGRAAAHRTGEMTTDRFGSRPWLAVITSSRPLSTK